MSTQPQTRPLAGKVALVTGATNGIGLITARELAAKGATVIAVGRSKARLADAVREIQGKVPGTIVESMVADLSVMDEVRRLATAVKEKFPRLDILVNNAGAVFTKRTRSSDGYEMTFALNHLSYFLLTTLLLDLLKANAPSRIVNVSSSAHYGTKLNFDDLLREKSYSGFGAYGQSKLANVVFTYELARRLAGTGVTANVLHPGFVKTGFGRNNAGLFTMVIGLIQNVAAISPEDGAKTSIYLASSPEVEGVTGKYFNKSKAVASSKESMDESTWGRLWEISEKLTLKASPATAP